MYEVRRVRMAEKECGDPSEGACMDNSKRCCLRQQLCLNQAGRGIFLALSLQNVQFQPQPDTST
jgi:hypothetical protein